MTGTAITQVATPSVTMAQPWRRQHVTAKWQENINNKRCHSDKPQYFRVLALVLKKHSIRTKSALSDKFGN